MPTTELDRLYAGQVHYVVVHPDGSMSADIDLTDRVVLAGSFNPVHRGHLRMMKAAERITGRRGLFEISIENVDKPDLPRDELEGRLKSFRGIGDVVVTRARLFANKAALLNGCWFVLGYDTAVRLLDDRYYPAGTSAEQELLLLNKSGTRFIVAGRVDASGKFRGLSDLTIPAGIQAMFMPIPESDFREDISSTELRRRRSE